MDLAKSNLGYPSVLAMKGLESISRVKDCRTIILQDSGGLDLVRKGLSSIDGSLVSHTLLLVVHLLWDEEWSLPLSTIEPRIELKTLEWGLFAMDKIINRAEKKKEMHSGIMERWKSLQVKAFCLEDGEEKERLQRCAKEEQQKIGKDHWLNLETEENRSPYDFLLGRALLVLSLSCRLENGPIQLLRAGGLSLFSSCLDCPIMDTRTASIGGLHNTMAAIGVE
mmetsp:Transcript_22238/g.48305  ORF Transcript_22238/g.48305 Transcript_22238/m.48305 type:complete len:224 (-) Transcript_22238:684-1355(-)